MNTDKNSSKPVRRLRRSQRFRENLRNLRNLRIRTTLRAGGRRLPAILASVLAAFWAAAGVRAAEVKMSQPIASVIEISGGEGKAVWRLHYGTRADMSNSIHRGLYPAGNDRAYFAHGLWLRLIDTRKGVVIGRWRFPSQILRVVPEGLRAKVEIEIGGTDSGTRRTLSFDPDAPSIPDFPQSFLFCYLLPRSEAYGPNYLLAGVLGGGLGGGFDPTKIPAERVRQLIPVMEEAIRRDPLSPWFRVVLGRLLHDAGDPRAAQVFQGALSVPTTDYTELLPISGHLEGYGQPETATLAFERGYADFWRRGNDPRLFTFLIGRLVTYAARWDQMSPAARAVYIERIYRLMPGGEGAAYAWQLYADWLRRAGQAEQARVWQARADEMRRSSLYPGGRFATGMDQVLYLVLASLLASFGCWLVQSLRYRPQMRLDAAARKLSGAPAPRYPVVYGTRRERLALLGIVLVGWLATGVGGWYVQGAIRLGASPISDGLGQFSSPATIANFQSFPATPQRDLLLAIGHQQAGQIDKAERLYRSLPQFPQSWNNLGVLLKEAGKEVEARQAFERALAADPGLAEAALNLGQPARSYWTEQHQKYLAGRPMLAPPTRQQMSSAYLGGSPPRVAWYALSGAFSGFLDRRLADSFAAQSVAATVHIPAAALITGMLFIAAVLLLLPGQEVTEPPGRRQYLWEIAFPGTAPAWRFAGAFVLVAWCYLLLQAALVGWSYVGFATRFYNPLSYIHAMMPNLPRAYAVPDAGMEQVYRLLSPGWVWLYLAPALLFAANLALVLKSYSPQRHKDH
jgi:tetratricopeptide (TPR) repeat protein